MKLFFDLKINLSPNNVIEKTGSFLRKGLKPKPKTYPIEYRQYKSLPLPHNMEHQTYIVKKGETIAEIAEQYGLDPIRLSESLKEEFGNENIYPGQEIKIPTLIKEKE